MFSFGDSPPPGKELPVYAGVAMVTSGGLVALTLILAACSFFRKLRGEGGDTQSEMYVEEFYSNPAFMDLPFDGSCSTPPGITVNTSLTGINPHAKESSASSHSPPNGSATIPQTVVVKEPVRVPYQEEPQRYVQENGHARVEESGLNCAIVTKDSNVENSLPGDSKNEVEKFGNGIVQTETVIVNPGALESFKKEENRYSKVGSKENLEHKNEHVEKFEGGGDLDLNNSPKRLHGKSKSSEMDTGEGVEDVIGATVRRGEKEGNGVGKGNVYGAEAGGDIDEKERSATMGSLNKRMRSLDNLYFSKQNGTTFQQVKKLKKMSGEEFQEDYSTKRNSIGKKGSGVFRRRSKNSFSKVQRPIFRSRRKVTQTEDKFTAEVIQNPFTF